MIEMESARSTETRSDLYRNVPFEFRTAEDTGPAAHRTTDGEGVLTMDSAMSVVHAAEVWR
jgi:hypothetical protein